MTTYIGSSLYVISITDPCKRNSCQHDGLCLHNGIDKTYCICKNGYTGNTCEKGKLYCTAV